MEIFDKETQQKLLENINNLYITNSNTSIENSFCKIEGRAGDILLNEMPKIKPRTFTVAGTLECVNAYNVEKIRSLIMQDLYGKKLKVFVHSTQDNIYYNCVLNGPVNITYYAGDKISRCFSISFSLLAYEGIGWNTNVIEEELSFQNNGIDFNDELFAFYLNFPYDSTEGINLLMTFCISTSKNITIKASNRPFLFWKEIDDNWGLPLHKRQVIREYNQIYLKRDLYLNKNNFYPLFYFCDKYYERTKCMQPDYISEKTLINPPFFSKFSSSKNCYLLMLDKTALKADEDDYKEIKIEIEGRPFYI